MEFNLHHQAVRDLAWCCTSAPLLATLPNSDTAIWPDKSIDIDIDWLIALDQNPTSLFTHLTQFKSTRLGLYYESLWHFYWQQHPQWLLLSRNQQLIQNGITVGAFDFIAQHGADFWHVETAVKFYLGVAQDNQSTSEWQQWIGPHCNDRLDIKLDRLRSHQLPLSTTDIGRQHLTRLTSADTHWQSALCLQGYLFYPANTSSMPAPACAHPQHERGVWWHLHNFLDFLSARTIHHDYWMILPRHQWLSPAQTEDINQLLHGDDLQHHLRHWVANNHRPQLLAAMERSDGVWREKHRGFVVPDHWPRTA